jgi:outer membrane receptor protein involved in Fe transport
MRRIFLLLIILTPILNFSQEKANPTYSISGKIIDANSKKPLEYATIVFKSLDSNQIKFGGITNQRGNFSIEVEKGSYNVTVEFISYKTKKLTISTISNDFDIGSILLELDTEILDEIEITAEKRALEIKPNKFIFNVEKDIAASGSMASEILNNIPAVSVDPNGNVSLRGQDNVTIMINGKISSLTKAEILKSLPAGFIEKIEVITNPGAKYSGSAVGIINIILKKEKDDGLNASITNTGGYKDYYGGLLTLNQKSKKINFFTNTSYFHRNPISIVTYENEYFNNDVTTSFLNESTENDRNANAFISNVGIDFFLSNKSTLTATVNYTNIDANNDSNTVTDFFDTSKNLTSTNSRNNIGTFNNEIIQIAANFEQNFNKEGKQLVSFIEYSNDNESFENNFTNTNSSFNNEDYTEENTLENTTFKINFSNSLNESTEYEVGYLGEFGNTPFRYISDTFNEVIHYKDHIHALFIDIGKQSKNFYYQLGLRAEFSDYTIDYSNLNTTLKKDFNDLFPSALFEYSFTETKSTSLSYSRKIRRPIYSELQPFEQKISEIITYVGNENLDPTYVNMVNLSYLNNMNNLTFLSSLYFNSYKNFIQLVTYETDESVDGIYKIISSPMNIGKLNQYGVNISAIMRTNNWLNFTGNINFYNLDQTGIYEHVNINNETIIKDYRDSNWEGSLSLLTKIKIPNVFDFQTNLTHNLESKAAFSKRKAYTYANATISKDIANNKATISLSIDDIFHSYKTKRLRFDDTYISNSEISNKNQTILFSFTYRFNQNKQDRKINFDKKEKEIKPIF